MTVSAPPRPPSPARTAPESKPLDRDEIEALVEALIEEARRETRRRHRRYWAVAALATFVGAVILILLDGGAASQTASPALSARSGAAGGTPSSKIAFLRAAPAYRSAAPYQLELDVINVDGSGLRRLARGPWSRDDQGFNAVPDWSPDGRKLVFAKRLERSGAPCRPAGRCNDEIYVINADGTGLRRLTRNAVPDGHPVWSPDGRRIAFLRWRDGPTANIYVMNADGSGQRKLTQTPRRQGELAWSPDGEKIAFSAPAGHLGAADIFVINADGSGLRNVTNTVTTSFDFAWSPDGRQIAYLEGSPSRAWRSALRRQRRRHRKAPTDAPPDGRPRYPVLVARRADARVHGRRRHLHRPRRRHRAAQAHRPRLTVPSGRRTGGGSSSSVAATIPPTTLDLFVMNADGSGQRNLTHTPNVSESSASWAPAPG